MKASAAVAVARNTGRRSDAMDRLDHFPRVWCRTCNKVQPLIFDVLKANDKNEHDAADIVCAECKSIIATLHAPDARRAGVRDKKVAKALEMATQEIDRWGQTRSFGQILCDASSALTRPRPLSSHVIGPASLSP